MKQKKIIAHLHSRIKLLADAAMALGPRPCYEPGEITQCDRQHDGGYIVTLSSDNIPTIYTAVGAGSLLYLLNSLAQGKYHATETEIETETETP
jgi:hypothetical protein